MGLVVAVRDLSRGEKGFSCSFVVAVLMVGIAFVLPPAVKAEILRGTGVLYLGAWDFSEQQTVDSMFDPAADLSIVLVVDPPLGPWQFGENGARITAVPDSSFEELTTAPEDSARYVWEFPALIGLTYVVWTSELCYGKYRILAIYPPTIEYAYQDDGSRILTDTVPAQETTWGKLKELYSSSQQQGR